MKKKLLLGIDIGTTNMKCNLYDLKGQLVANAKEKNAVINYGDGRMEQDMDLLWNKISSLVNILIKDNDINPEDIEAIGLTGQGEGCWLADKEGNPVGNAILWSDGRSQLISSYIQNNKELLETYRQTTGSYPFSGAQIIILKWLSENEPHILERAEHIFFCKDWIRFKLTDEANIEYTDASTSILNLKNKQIAEELLKALNIESYRRLLPELRNSTEIGGYITKKASKITGLKAGTPVVVGLMDIAATALGAGAINENDCCTILGTTCCNEVVTLSFVPQEDTVAGYEIHALNKKYLNVMATMAGTPNIDWFVDEFLGDLVIKANKEKYNFFDCLEKEMEKVGVGSGGIIYHPYISPSGERAPFANSSARAQFFGMSSSTTRFHLIRSVYEGIAYSIRDCIESSSRVDTIYLTGGGAKSRFWAQMISDITGKKLYIVEDFDPAAKGAAIIAGLGIGLYSDVNSIVETTLSLSDRINPDPENYEFYTQLYNIYLELRYANSHLWEKRNEIMKKREVF